ncbi:MAG: class I SAM-dependent methyltransferase [Chromatiales bacterium]|jgi:predicted O-methyltransferase YrrM
MEKSDIRFTGELRDYLFGCLRDSDELKALRNETAQLSNAIMQIPPEQGQFMTFLVQAIGARKALEIGVFTGYSALSIALGLSQGGKLVACDINEEWPEIGRPYWRQAGVEDKIDLRIGPALQTLDQLIADGEVGSFDFVFIDADKPAYDDYYEKSLQLLRTGGVIAIDNVLLFGTVLESGKPTTGIDEASVNAMRKLNVKIKQDVRVDQTMLPLADGLTLVRKR